MAIRSKTGCLVSTIALIAAMSPAVAQEVRGPESPAPTAKALSPAATLPDSPAQMDSGGGLGDIIVTARKVSENLQNVPVAVTAISGAGLQQQSAVRIPDIARLTPGLTFSPASSTATAVAITVRGQVQTDVLATLDPSVGTYVDGFYWARAYGLNSDLLDIQSAQVLRGPQGTLFGRNTTGGAILLQTNDPTYNLSGLASATYGRFNERSATAVLNVPLVEDKVAVRGAFVINKRDGFFTDTTNGRKIGERDSYSGRVKLLLNPVDNLTVLFSAEYFHTDALTRPFQLQYVGASSPANIEAGFEVFGPGAPGTRLGQGAALFNTYIASIADSDRVTLNEDPRGFAKTQTYTGTVTLDTYFGAIKFIGGYRKVRATSNVDLEGSPYNIVRTFGQQDLESYSGELQITGKAFDDRLDYVAGAFAFQENGSDQSTSIALPSLTRASTGGLLPQQIFFGDVDTRSMGVYSQATFHFTDQLSATGGARYSVDDKGITSFNRTVNADTGAQLACSIIGARPADCRIAKDNSFGGVSYTAGINYQASRDLLIYAKTSKGFRSGGQNLRASGAAGSAFVAFQPEIAREEEVGLKGEFFDRRVRVNLAGFYNEVSDIQRTVLVTSVINNVTSTSTIVGNAGKARFYGGEAEVTAQVFDGFTIAGTAALVKAKYLKYVDSGTGEDRRDEVFQQVPKYTFSLAANYEHEVGFGKFMAHADYAWQGKTALYNYRTKQTGVAATDAMTNALANALTRPAGGELNARLGVTVLNDSLDIAVYGRNVLDRRVNTTGLLFGSPLFVASTQRNDPATYGITATFRFGNR